MTIRNPHALKAQLSPGQRLVGLDVGEKTIGVAISDEKTVTITATKATELVVVEVAA